MMSFSLGWPLALFGLLVLPLLWLFGLKSRLMRSPGRRRQLFVMRALAVTAVVLAVAGLRVGLPTDDLSVAVVTDPTPRISDSERGELTTKIAQLSAAQPDTFVDVPSTGNPARDLALAAASMPRDHVRRLLVATDGREPSMDMRVAIDAARRDGTHVWVTPLGDRPAVDTIAISGVELPRLIRAGETIGVSVALHASNTIQAPLTVEIDGERATEETVRAEPGPSAHTIAVTFPEAEGVHEISVALPRSVGGDPQNDRWHSLVRVISRPRVLIVHTREQGEPALAAVLRDAEFNVQLAKPAEAPTDRAALDRYGLVLIDETSPADLTEPQQQALRDWVELDGGGLVTITGGHPVLREPEILRAIEPIRPPPAIPEPRPLELVLVIDRSSSMSGANMSLARRGAIAAVQALREDARVGVVAFSGAADRVVPLMGMDQRDQIISFIGAIHADGGTDIGAALRAANGVVSDDPRYIRHVVILSDGESDPGPALAAANAIAGRGANITAITIGPYSDLMSMIAQIGRGQYHVTYDPSSLPRLLVRAAQFRQPPAHRNVNFTPRVVSAMPMLDQVPFDSAPQLGGYSLAVARRGATTVLGTPEADGALLAHWYVQLGQVASFTSNTDGGWADEWRTWDGFRTFWSGLAWGMLRTRTVEPVELHLSTPIAHPNQRVLTVVGASTELRPEPIIELHRGRTGDAERLRLLPRGPGVWQTTVPLRDGILITGRMPEHPEPTAAVGDERPYREAMRRFGVDQSGLAALAALGGGEVVADPAAITQNVESQPAMVEARNALLGAAIALYLLSLLLLRLPDRRQVAPSIPVAKPRAPAALDDKSSSANEAA